METMNNKPIVARVSNRFAVKGKIGITGVKQLRVLIGAISRINPFDEENEMGAFISMQELKEIVKGEIKARESFADIRKLIKSILKSNFIEYPTDFIYEGVMMSNYRVLFDKIEVKEKDGKHGYYFRFHNDMRPDFQNLFKNYLSFELSKGLKSGSSFRFSIVLMSYHNQHKAHKDITELMIELGEFRRILNLENKYPRFNSLRERVISKIMTDINNIGVLNVWYKTVKSGKSVTDLIFYMKDGKLAKPQKGKGILDLPDYIPSKEEIETLTKSQLKAYEILTEFGVTKGIAFRQILMKINGSEAKGFEDVFIKKALEYFEKKARKKNAGTFTKWWTEKKIFDSTSDVWTTIMEGVVSYKKKLEREKGEAFQNRMIAKEMTDKAFKVLLQNKQRKQSTTISKTEGKKQDRIKSIGDILGNSKKG